MRPVLILDANQRSALAATRALGAAGIPVITADETMPTLAGSSKHCSGAFTYPSPCLHPEAFITAVQRAVESYGVGVIFPMTDVTVYLIAQFRERFPRVSIPVGSMRALDTLLDKWELARLAQALGIPVPHTYAAGAPRDVRAACRDIRYPVIVKPRRSRTWINGRCVAGRVHYARSVEELDAALSDGPDMPEWHVLVQEHIRGEGQGVFALCVEGEPVTFFAHRRLREKPPSGGVSVLSESIALRPQIRDMARRLLALVGWHGVAMLEFKVTAEGRPYLIEVNPRFWGSLQLAIDAGADFPRLLHLAALGSPAAATTNYRVGVRSRWLLGDLDHLYLRLRGALGPDLAPRQKWRALAAFLNFFAPATRCDVNRWSDPRPALIELRQWLQDALHAARNTASAPHAPVAGAPRLAERIHPSRVRT